MSCLHTKVREDVENTISKQNDLTSVEFLLQGNGLIVHFSQYRWRPFRAGYQNAKITTDETEEEIKNGKERDGRRAIRHVCFIALHIQKGESVTSEDFPSDCNIGKQAGKDHYIPKPLKLCLIHHLRCDYFKREIVPKIQLATSFLDPVVLFSPPHKPLSKDWSRILRWPENDSGWCMDVFLPLFSTPCNLTKRRSFLISISFHEFFRLLLTTCPHSFILLFHQDCHFPLSPSQLEHDMFSNHDFPTIFWSAEFPRMFKGNAG